MQNKSKILVALYTFMMLAVAVFAACGGDNDYSNGFSNGESGVIEDLVQFVQPSNLVLNGTMFSFEGSNVRHRVDLFRGNMRLERIYTVSQAPTGYTRFFSTNFSFSVGGNYALRIVPVMVGFFGDMELAEPLLVSFTTTYRAYPERVNGNNILWISASNVVFGAGGIYRIYAMKESNSEFIHMFNTNFFSPVLMNQLQSARYVRIESLRYRWTLIGNELVMAYTYGIFNFAEFIEEHFDTI